MIRVTVEDTETGETETAEIWDDYILICAGSCYLADTQASMTTGAHQLTVKGRKAK